MAFVITNYLSQAGREQRTSNIALWGVLLGVYLLNTYSAFDWIMLQAFAGISPLGLLCVGSILLAIIIRFVGWPERRLSREAIALILACCVLSQLSFPLLQQLSVAFALMGFYGFLSGFPSLPQAYWRQGFILAVLFALVIPFALVRGTGLGFYLRLMTADATAHVLSWAGHASLGAHDVLIFDNGIAQVDAPCSGLKSLFTGTGFFLLASLVLRRRVSRKWLGLYVLFIGSLLVANTLRVIILIYLSEVSGLHSVAEKVHVPLGLVLFSLCCVFAMWGLKQTKTFNLNPNEKTRISPNWLGALALMCLIALSFTKITSAPDFTPRLAPPETLTLNSVDLTPTEVGFFEARDNTQAAKWLFKYGELSGSMLVVHSRAANGLHAPEVCFLGNGISVNTMQSVSTPDATYRWLTVDENRRSAMYWMQSGDMVTDDFRVRLSRFIFGNHRDWTLVTVLLDARHNPDTDAVQSLRSELIAHYQDKES